MLCVYGIRKNIIEDKNEIIVNKLIECDKKCDILSPVMYIESTLIESTIKINSMKLFIQIHPLPNTNIFKFKFLRCFQFQNRYNFDQTFRGNSIVSFRDPCGIPFIRSKQNFVWSLFCEKENMDGGSNAGKATSILEQNENNSYFHNLIVVRTYGIFIVLYNIHYFSYDRKISIPLEIKHLPKLRTIFLQF